MTYSTLGIFNVQSLNVQFFDVQSFEVQWVNPIGLRCAGRVPQSLQPGGEHLPGAAARDPPATQHSRLAFYVPGCLYSRRKFEKKWEEKERSGEN